MKNLYKESLSDVFYISSSYKTLLSYCIFNLVHDVLFSNYYIDYSIITSFIILSQNKHIEGMSWLYPN